MRWMGKIRDAKCIPEWKRPLGRHKRKLKYDIEKDFKETGY
jgi:hypothetical protein